MRNQPKTKVVYVTSSDFKKEENRVFANCCKLSDGTPVSDLFEFEFRNVSILEVLEVDLLVMVQAEVTKAYSQLKVPCIVEHAGLLFTDFIDRSYPGGLTKPMWNALQEEFITETNSAGRNATARAVIAYCDGKSVKTFVGETTGKLADSPRGHRKFYWDTIFMPDDPSGKATGKTYAEIVEAPGFGIEYKMEYLSQSSRALLKFLEFLRTSPDNDLWG